jgi:hypothetical protein
MWARPIPPAGPFVVQRALSSRRMRQPPSASLAIESLPARHTTTAAPTASPPLPNFSPAPRSAAHRMESCGAIHPRDQHAPQFPATAAAFGFTRNRIPPSARHRTTAAPTALHLSRNVDRLLSRLGARQRLQGEAAAHFILVISTPVSCRRTRQPPSASIAIESLPARHTTIAAPTASPPVPKRRSSAPRPRRSAAPPGWSSGAIRLVDQYASQFPDAATTFGFTLSRIPSGAAYDDCCPDRVSTCPET